MPEPTRPSGLDELTAIASLGEPTRRAVYDYVVRQPGWVSRDEAAQATGLERGTATHHLERLASVGLLEVGYQRLTGRQGPGAGRPAKLYRRARRDFDVSVPPRDYQLAGRLLADAVERSRREHTDIATALESVAAEEGRRLAQHVRERLGALAGGKAVDRRRATLDVLSEMGYEPSMLDDGTVLLRNCPFHQLARRHTELICGMNLCLLDAAIEELGRTGWEARLEPREHRCCVELRGVGMG